MQSPGINATPVVMREHPPLDFPNRFANFLGRITVGIRQQLPQPR
jgi:hypothetical protein